MAEPHPLEEGDWPLKRLMTEVVGSGHKSADDMTRAQAREAMARILQDTPDPTTLGAFWLANRWKRNTAEELAAFLDVINERTTTRVEPSVDPVDCGANYDGKGRTALLGVAAGLVAAAAGTPVVVHSADRVPTQKQDAYRHVLDALGVETALTPTESAAMVDETGFGFYYRPRFAPAVESLHDRRDQMGVRTFLNTVETLSNPSGADVHLGSFYHLPFAKRLIETFRQSDTSPVDRVVMFQGLEGYDDVRPGTTVVAEWDGGDTVDDFEIRTAEYGMDFDEAALSVDEVAADSARLTEEVLAGEREDAFADAVALNAALRMYAHADVSDLHTGVETARDVMADGRAAEALATLRSR
ncbi:MAG: anthranilate phosphoribosyltransferase [Halobacteriaceae archaeon]